MFKNYRISDVFYKVDTPKIRAKANDFPTTYSPEYCVPLLTAGAENQGLNRYARISDCPMIINNAISVSANGANSGICFYQPHGFAVLQDAYAVKINGREIGSTEEGLYLTGAMNKAIRDNHDWVNKAGWNHIKDDAIELPVIEHPDPNHEYTVDDIDWQYMRERIQELERERIQELDAYLKATGLNDYELTIDEEMALKGFFDKNVSIKKIKIAELFSSETGDTDIQKSDINGLGLPVISSGIGSRGIIGNTDVSAKIIDNPSITVDMFGNVFYRDEPYKMVTHARVFSLIPLQFSLDQQLGEYFEAQIKKACTGFDYNNMCSFTKIRDKEIEVPVNPDGTINFVYIYIYIYEQWKKKQSRKLFNTKNN